MEKLKSLNIYQKGVLIFMTVLALVFAVVYAIRVSRVGFEYKGTILVSHQENGSKIYSGKIQGKRAKFTVSEDKTVEFQYGDSIYGPYTRKEDPTAIPKGIDMGKIMTGVELRQGEDILFRGGILKIGSSYLLYSEDGSFVNERVAPSISAILELMNEPALTHKGSWLAWFGAVFICILNAIYMVFADDLFRWSLAFRIRNTEHAEPSDWEIESRYIVWTIMPLFALGIFILGLR